ncbi:hypothetical protein KEM56_006940 [Ascosphaera pollenicola]|nr:hypothetical protein KEM56_006940 [Ascosphaera pollenicola]
MVSRRPRSKKQSSSLSAAYKPSITGRGLRLPNVQSTYRAPSEYIDQAGNRVVVPPIILHVNQAPHPQDQSGPVAKEKEEKKMRSASSGCYIVKNGKRILKNKGWSVTSSSEDLSEGGNEAFEKPEHMSSTKVNSDGWIAEEPSDCVPQVCDTKNEQAWMSWIKGTGIQHDGNSAAVKNLNMHSMPGANAHSSWNANNAHTAVATTSMAAAAQPAANGQNAQSAVSATNAQQNLDTDSWTQPGYSDWNRDSGLHNNTTTRVAGEWGEQSSSWNNINSNDTSNWDQQQITSSSDWNQAGAQINTAWNATGTNGVQGQTTSVGNNNSNDWSQPAAASQPSNAGEWTSNADNQLTENTVQSESWDVNCPGKWTEGPSNWGDCSAKAAETTAPPAESQQTAVKETLEQPKDNSVRQNKGKCPQHTRAETIPIHPSCRTPGIILLNETPLYEVPASVAAGRALSHQVQPGQESSYVHRIQKPRYIDTLQQPYAKFVFHYRKADIIEKQFHVKLTPNAAEERMKLEKLPKTEILNRLLMAQGLLDEDTLLQSKTHAAHSGTNEHSPTIPIPRNANAGIPSSAMSAVHFGPTETSNEQSNALFGTEPVSWHQQQSAGAQGFLQTVNSKLQAHVEDAQESQQGSDGWLVRDESAVYAW